MPRFAVSLCGADLAQLDTELVEVSLCLLLTFKKCLETICFAATGHLLLGSACGSIFLEALPPRASAKLSFEDESTADMDKDQSKSVGTPQDDVDPVSRVGNLAARMKSQNQGAREVDAQISQCGRGFRSVKET